MSTEPNQESNYYAAGSTALASETPLTLKRLESRRILTKTSSRLVIVLVGLPARGKSFLARKLHNFLNWSGVRCRIFNVGKYRREAYATLQKLSSNNGSEAGNPGACDADFFDTKNEVAAQLREKVAELALLDMLRWLDDEEETSDIDESVSNHQYLSNSSHHDNLVEGGGGDTGSEVNFRLPRSKFQQNEKIAIYDATNSTHKRRQWILEQCTSPSKRPGRTLGVIFVESLCDDKELLMENYRFKVNNSPDYKGMTYEESIQDLMKRVQKYEEQYESIADDTQSYIKIFNLSTKLLLNHIYGRLAKDLVPALMAWHIGSRPIFLVRPGQTVPTSDAAALEDPRLAKLSAQARKKASRGDTLGPKGIQFRAELLDFMYKEVRMFLQRRASVQDMANTGTSMSGFTPEIYDYSLAADGGGDEEEDDEDYVYGKIRASSMSSESGSIPLRVLASTMPRALDTVIWDEAHNINVFQMSSLNPLDKGDFAGLELEEIRDMHPDWYEMLEADPYGTRFPGGECYRDLIRRLSSVVVDLEQQVIPTLVVSHVSILQCLIAYFRTTPIETCMSIEVPLHTVIKFEPVRGGGYMETRHPMKSFGPTASSPGGPHLNRVLTPSSSNIPIWGDHNDPNEDPISVVQSG